MDRKKNWFRVRNIFRYSIFTSGSIFERKKTEIVTAIDSGRYKNSNNWLEEQSRTKIWIGSFGGQVAIGLHKNKRNLHKAATRIDLETRSHGFICLAQILGQIEMTRKRVITIWGMEFYPRLVKFTLSANFAFIFSFRTICRWREFDIRWPEAIWPKSKFHIVEKTMEKLIE